MAPHCPRWLQIAKDGSRWHEMLPECAEGKRCPSYLDFYSLSSGRSRIRKMWRRFQIAPDGPDISKWLQMIPDSPDIHTELLSGEVIFPARAVASVCYQGCSIAWMMSDAAPQRSRWLQMAPDVPTTQIRWHQIAPDGPTAPKSSRWFWMAPDRPRRIRIAPDGSRLPKMVPDDTRCFPDAWKATCSL